MILKGYPRISRDIHLQRDPAAGKTRLRIHLFSMRRGRESFHPPQCAADPGARWTICPKHCSSPCRACSTPTWPGRPDPGAYPPALVIAWQRWRRTHKSATLKHLFQAGYLVKSSCPASAVVHLHAHFAHSPTSVAMFASRLSGLPFSFTAHAKDIYTSDPRQAPEKIALARLWSPAPSTTGGTCWIWPEAAPDGIHRVYHGIDIALLRR